MVGNHFLDVFDQIKVHRALYAAKIEDKNEPGGSRESEQVRETPEEFLDWYMNRTQFDISDKMVELEDSIEKDCS